MAAFWYKFFSFIKLRWLFNLTLAGMATFACYALGFFLAILIDVYYLKDREPVVEYSQTLPEAKNTRVPIKEYSKLMLSNMFNTLTISNDFLEDIQDAKLSNLDNITLQGTVIWTNVSIAIFIKDNQTWVVKKDDKIPNSDITLADIKNKRALIKSGPTERWLEIENNKSTDRPSASSQLSTVNNPPPPDQNKPAAQAVGGVNTAEIKNGRQEVFVTKERAEYELSNFSRLISQARVFPNFTETGVADGFAIDSIETSSIFDQIGLKNGDIIKTVNGTDIDTPEKAFELIRLLRNEKVIRLSVSRNSSPLEITYYIE